MSFKDLREEFSKWCSSKRDFPEMKDWYKKIRNSIPNAAIYIVFHDYVSDGGSDRDAYLLLTENIDWHGHRKNSGKFREAYFHKSKYDTNIWILKKKHRTDTNAINFILRDNKLTANAIQN